MLVLIVLCVVAFIVVLYGTKLYNALVALKNNVRKSWANIDVLLKQRHDEIPKLVDVCSGYMKYERDTLEAVVKARSAAVTSQGVGAQAQSEGTLSAALGKLFALSEKYPDLKANENFGHLRNRVSEIENQIADRREFYNDSVNIYNIRIQQIPDSFLASILNYQPETLFAATAAEKEDVKIAFNMP